MEIKDFYSQVKRFCDELTQLLDDLGNEENSKLELQYEAYLGYSIDSLSDLKDVIESNHKDELDNEDFPLSLDELPY